MKRSSFAMVFASLFLAQTVALAQSPAPPSFIYKINMSAGPGTGSMDYSMDVAINATMPDGTRKATLTIHAPKMMQLNNKAVDATISPFGALTIGSTGEMPKNFNPYSVADAKKMSEAAQGPMVQMLINPMNAFANGFAKAPAALKPGATWQAFSNEAQATVQYTVTGREQRNGRDTVVVTMQSTPGSGGNVTGQGNYDPAAHLIVNVHCEIRQTAQDKNGQVIDVAMVNP